MIDKVFVLLCVPSAGSHDVVKYAADQKVPEVRKASMTRVWNGGREILWVLVSEERQTWRHGVFMRNVLVVNTVASFKPRRFPVANLSTKLLKSIKFKHGHKILTSPLHKLYKTL